MKSRRLRRVVFITWILKIIKSYQVLVNEPDGSNHLKVLVMVGRVTLRWVLRRLCLVL
jgi:hypothetical protein